VTTALTLPGAGTDPAVRGHLDAWPLILGYLPFALVLGTAIARSPVADLAGWATSPLIFAGAAQLAILEVVGSDGSVAIAIVSALVINLRHVMYSAAMAPWFRDAGTAWQLTAPFLLNDPQYTLVSSRFPTLEDDRARRRYYLGLGLTLWSAWASLTALAILAGNRLPATLDLGPAVPLTFVALLVPGLTDRPTLAAALTGGGVAVATDGLPLHLGLLAGAIAGIAAGAVLDPEVRP
jgi:predicted branched-subunit amino acid permease